MERKKVIEKAKTRYPDLPWESWEKGNVEIIIEICGKEEEHEVEELDGMGANFSADSRILAGNYKIVEKHERSWSSGLAQCKKRTVRFKLGRGGMLIFRKDYGDSLGRIYDYVKIYYCPHEGDGNQN